MKPIQKQQMISANANANVSPAIPSSSSSTSDVPSSSSVSSASSLSASSQTRLLLLRVVHSAYRRWAFFIVAHAHSLILFCTLLSTICTLKVATTPHQNDITGYTPYGARSRQELSIREQFFNSQGLGPPFGVFLLLLPRSAEPRRHFLDAEMLAEAARIDDFVRHNFTLINHGTNRSETFAQFCRDFCDMNEPLRRFEEGFRHQSERLAANDTLNPSIHLDYPVSAILGRKFNIQPNFFGVHLANNKEAFSPSSSSQLSNMERVEMLSLNYRAERVGGWTDAEVKQWEMAIAKYFESADFRNPLIRVLIASTTYVEVEVVRAGLSMLPFLVVGFCIMFCCSSAIVLLSARCMGQMSANKLWLAFMACVCPFMATGTALGLLFLCGVRFGSVLCVTPFLVLAIGVDDAYLMIHAWQRIGRKRQKEEGGEQMEVAERMALVLIDTGPAILISALTNICADAIGSFTGSPEITLLCIGNMAAIAVDFLFQITFYAAVMALVGQAELRANQRKEGKQFRVRIPIGGMETMAAAGRGNAIMEKEKEEEEENAIGKREGGGGGIFTTWKIGPTNESAIERSSKSSGGGEDRLESFVAKYVQFIIRPPVAFAICLGWLAFLIVSAIGISHFQVNLSTKKLFASDSPLLEIDHYREEDIVPIFTVATVFVNNPGNLSDAHRMERLNKLVQSMEELPGNWGPPSTNYFIRELAEFVGDEETETPLMERLGEFLEWPEHRYWKAFLRLRNGNGTKGQQQQQQQLDRFFFTTAFHGQQLREWPERTNLLKEWRAVVDQFREDLNATVFHEEGIFLDLIDNMPSDAWQSSVATLLCMCLICAIFMGHDWRTVLVAGTTIGSIIVGTLGILAWMGVSMDPIMMAALIISIGFSVDIPAHVSYHFHSSAYEANAHVVHSPPSSTATSSPSKSPIVVLPLFVRLHSTLVSIGPPALQASLSTSLCVLALLFVPLYMAQIFVRIMLSCIFLCVLHSLLLIPALFSLIELAKSLFTTSTDHHK